MAVCALSLGVPGPGAQAADLAGGPRTGAGHAPLTIFRVDVSQYPRIGLVVTVPGASRTLRASNFSVIANHHMVHLAARQLAPLDLELVLAPAANLGAAALSTERAESARFLAGLPTGTRTMAVDPATPGILPGRLTGDPAPAVAAIASLPPARTSTAGAALATALSAFTTGPHVRRTVVLVVSRNQSLTRETTATLRRRLVASGTALYVLDATPGGAPDYDALAAGSGGSAGRIRVPADWASAFSLIARSLSEQYYLRFTDPGPLPGRVTVAVSTATGTARGTVDLPRRNPIAPPLPPAPKPPKATVPSPWDRPLVLLAALLIVFGVSYGMGMLAASRRDPPRPGGRRKSLAGARQAITDRNPRSVRDDLFFVFMMPCLNEEKVLLNSLQRLLSIPGDGFVVLVIDDGSDDNTVDAVSGILGERVWLLSRKPPHAREGKGEALNAGVRYLTGSGHLAGRDPHNVIVVVVDADGRLDPQSIEEVRPYFANPTIGAVQIGVRINNREQSRLARMQDMEFVIYTEVFQRGRRHLGSVGLGGNGQFMRLSAMMSLGPSPWTRSLTDDLDLGVRLIAAGWRNEYCSTVAVHQQGVVELRRLIRQRSRWFQGHLQSWKLIPLVLRSVPRRARADLLYHLSSPAILLVASLLSASFLLSMVNSVILAAEGQNPFGWWIASTYALTFGPALAFSFVYWLRERSNGVGVLRTVMFAHMYVCYGMMWYASGWWAVGRTLRGRTGWAKTDRVAEAPALDPVRLPVPTVLLPQSVPLTASASAAASAGGVAVLDSPRPLVANANDDTLVVPAVRPPGDVVIPAPLRPLTAHADDDTVVIPVVELPIASAPDVPEPRQPAKPRRRRRLVAAAALVACAICVAVVAETVTGGNGPGPWLTVFNGYGTISMAGSGPHVVVDLRPAATESRKVTHSALVVSRSAYRDFVATLHVRTSRQLRHGAAGSPNPWEVGWVVWDYTSNQRFYALTLEPTGWVLSKQDPAYRGGERFLASGRTPVFRLGVPHTVGIVQVGNQITVSADGRLLTHFTDTQRPYLTGEFGFYCEDAQTSFSQIRLLQLPPPQAPRPDTAFSAYPSRKAPVTDATS
jgi:cellulose synthase/poly-beta-1,6-N-acetylglucosamine synthase-like glycosyltransferase